MTSDDQSAGFRSRSRDVVESFLQSVVALDDLPMMPTGEQPVSGMPSGPLATPEYPQSPAPVDPVRGRDPTGVLLNAEAVIAGFAEIGSVCAVLSAAPGREFRERTVRAARRADIVILDWKIQDSVGNEALAVMRDILDGDRHSQRLRLLAIYTGEPDLGGIYERVRGEVSEFYEEHELEEREWLRMSKGPLHIVVLAKGGVHTGPQGESPDPQVTEDQLAERLTDEFAQMVGGLLRNTAIAGIAAIRDNAHRILAKFEKGLDPAYLGHRLLLPYPPDAEDHIEEALGAEINSVIEEHRPGAHANIEAIRSWLALRESEGLPLSEPFSFEASRDAVDAWSGLLLQGIDAPDASLPRGVGKSGLRKQVTEPFTLDPETAGRSDRGFAALLSLKTRYPGRAPRLAIGTVLRTEGPEESRYLLCLQPKCDCVRLDTITGFPLIPLIPLEAAEVGGNGMDLRLIVETERDRWEHFAINAKPSDLTVRFFEPGTSRPGEVTAYEDPPGRFYFDDADGLRYWWIAEMKDEHALKVAGELASALARPGPNDSEWLRRARGARR